MHSRWSKAGFTKEDLRKFIPAFKALKEILEQDLTKEPVRDYGPGWDHKQIAVNEYNAAISDILKLLTVEKD